MMMRGGGGEDQGPCRLECSEKCSLMLGRVEGDRR